MRSGQEPHTAGGTKSSHLRQEGAQHRSSVVNYIALAPKNSVVEYMAPVP